MDINLSASFWNVSNSFSSADIADIITITTFGAGAYNLLDGLKMEVNFDLFFIM